MLSAQPTRIVLQKGKSVGQASRGLVVEVRMVGQPRATATLAHFSQCVGFAFRMAKIVANILVGRSFFILKKFISCLEN